MFCQSEGGGGGQINCQININNFSYLIKPALNTQTEDIHLTTVLFSLKSQHRGMFGIYKQVKAPAPTTNELFIISVHGRKYEISINMKYMH